MTHICVVKLTIIGSDNGLSPWRHQAIIWTKAGILLIGPLGTNFSEFLIAIHTFSFNKMHLKMSSAKWHPFCLGLDVLKWRLITLSLDVLKIPVYEKAVDHKNLTLFMPKSHHNDVIMSVMASQITSLTIVYSGIFSGSDQRKQQSSASLAFVRGIHRWPVHSPHKGPVTRKILPFDDVIMFGPGSTARIVQIIRVINYIK